jgi:hypothetical protein
MTSMAPNLARALSRSPGNVDGSGCSSPKMWLPSPNSLSPSADATL